MMEKVGCGQLFEFRKGHPMSSIFCGVNGSGIFCPSCQKTNAEWQQKIQKAIAEYEKYDVVEKALKDFVNLESSKFYAGSGDDAFYVQQVHDYVESQHRFWINAFRKFSTEALQKLLEDKK